MTGQHWNELARSVCKTKSLSIWALCRKMNITPQYYYHCARNGMSSKVSRKMMYKIRKIMFDETHAI